MTTGIYEIPDMSTEEGRAKVDAYERETAEMVRHGQQLYARIKRSSKYYGQGEKGALFEVYVEAIHPEAYLVHGAPGDYRLRDVNLYIVEAGRELQIS
jgi:hypothetical protein